MDVLVDAATQAGLNIDRFKVDIKDPEALKTIAADYEEARSKYGVFGVPTIVSDDGNAAFVKMMPPPAPDKALEVFEDVFDVIARRPDVHEIKRPEPPES